MAIRVSATDEQKRSYSASDLMEISVSNIMQNANVDGAPPSLETALPFETFLWCDPERIEFHKRVQHQIALDPKSEFSFKETCEKWWTRESVKLFADLVDRDFGYQFVLDGLPAALKTPLDVSYSKLIPLGFLRSAQAD